MMIVVTVFDYAWKPFYLSRYNEEAQKNSLPASLLICAVLLGHFPCIFSVYRVFGSIAIYRWSFYRTSYWTGLAIVPVILLAFFINGSQSHFAAAFS
jgi:hypothetical protein